MMLISSSTVVVLFALLSVYHVSVPSACAAAAASDADRLAELQAKSKSSRGNVIKAPVSSLRSYLEAAPRSYNLVVMFTAGADVCQPCKKVSDQFRITSSDYNSANARSKSSKPTFFMEVILSQSEQAFLSAYRIQAIPIIYHFGAGKSKSYPRPLSDTSPDSFNLPQVGYHANAIKAFVNERTGSKMHVVRGGYEIPFVQTVRQLKPYIIVCGAIAALICGLTGAYKNPMLWFGLVVLVYIFSVGGGHYSWIHNTPLAVVDKSGRMQYIAGGSRSQYVAEGFFVSFTCVCISGLVIAIQELPSYIPNKSGQTAVGSMMFFLTVGAIGALLALYQMVSFLYSFFQKLIPVSFIYKAKIKKLTAPLRCSAPYQIENATIPSIQRNVIDSFRNKKETKIDNQMLRPARSVPRVSD